MRDVIKGNEACAVGAKLSRPNVIAAFPITPSTLFPERISEFVADGELDAEFVPVESEHSAMSACIGASATGARTCTATASQGLALMHEMLFIASGMRLPIVISVANRALSAPINIWCDHQDSISERDTGWMQFYAESNQEALDLMILGFKIAENEKILLPAMVCLDAFVLTHTMEPVDIPDQKDVDEFLPTYKPKYAYLDPKDPMTQGAFCPPDTYMEFKLAQEIAMENARTVIDKEFKNFAEKFGRNYQKIVSFKTEDADIILLTMGSMSGTAKEAVRDLRAKGMKVGLAKLTVFRPFPFKELKEITKNAKVIAVVDRNISFGFGGAVYAEVSASFINEKQHPIIMDFILGLGGRDILKQDFVNIVEKASLALKTGKAKMVEWINVNREMIP